jgi:hypothetical protein
MSNKPTAKDKRIISSYRQGLQIADISKLHKIRPNFLYKILDKFNVPRRNPRRDRNAAIDTHMVNGLHIEYSAKEAPQYRVDGKDAYIALSKDKEAIISIEDLDKVKMFKWTYNSTGYASCLVNVKGGRLSLYLHQLITDVGFGMQRFNDSCTSSELLADHIDGDRANNRRENLRPVTHQENMQNIHYGLGYHTSNKPKRKHTAEDLQSVSW